MFEAITKFSLGVATEAISEAIRSITLRHLRDNRRVAVLDWAPEHASEISSEAHSLTKALLDEIADSVGKPVHALTEQEARDFVQQLSGRLKDLTREKLSVDSERGANLLRELRKEWEPGVSHKPKMPHARSIDPNDAIIWNHNQQLVERVRKVSAEIRRTDRVAHVMTSLHNRASSGLSSVFILKLNSLHESSADVACILYSLFRLSIQASFISRAPEKRSKMFSDFADVERYRDVSEMEGLSGPVVDRIKSNPNRQVGMAHLSARYASFVSQHAWTPTTDWHPIGLEGMAKDVGVLSEWKVIGNWLASIVNASPFGLQRGDIPESAYTMLTWTTYMRTLRAYIDTMGIRVSSQDKDAIDVMSDAKLA